MISGRTLLLDALHTILPTRRIIMLAQVKDGIIWMAYGGWVFGKLRMAVPLGINWQARTIPISGECKKLLWQVMVMYMPQPVWLVCSAPRTEEPLGRKCSLALLPIWKLEPMEQYMPQ